VVNLDLFARLIRRFFRRAEAQRKFPSVNIQSMPILFGNSFPKSGTHLLTQILAGFAQLGPVVESGLPPIQTFDGETGRQIHLQTILSDLQRLAPGDIAYGHLHALPEIVQALSKPGVVNYFIYRDPRDVVVSHVFYVTDINNHHVHHDYYINQLRDFDQRLKTSILGRPELDISFPDIRTRFEPYLAWLDRRQVLSLRYENLQQEIHSELARIFDHALGSGFMFSGDRNMAINVLSQSIKPSKSPTFRSGVSGDWKKHFTLEMKDLFKDITGDLLIRLGYEQNQNW
jgi:hypothetical protein